MPEPDTAMSEMAIEYQRRPIRVDEYHRMEEVGIIGSEERVELLDGEMVLKPVMNPRHAAAVTRLSHLLVHRLLDSALVRVQLPLQLNDRSEPEPDLAIVRPDPRYYADHHPLPSDVLLLIEVSDSSRSYDLGKKAAAYALAGIAELWIVDLIERRLYVMCDPDHERYALTSILKPSEHCEARGLPKLAFATDDLLG
jgi:Uma2 family endonuclease